VRAEPTRSARIFTYKHISQRSEFDGTALSLIFMTEERIRVLYFTRVLVAPS
jgi:hypothetical protein